MSTTDFYSRADNTRYIASVSPVNSAIPQIILTVLAGLCGSYVVLDLFGFPVRFWLRLALGMAWERFVDLVPERVVFALDPSLNPYSNTVDANTEQKKPERMQAAKSEVLRKAFRLDGLGLFKSAQTDGPLRGISMLMKGTHSDAPPGLGNWDNSCYQNSVIQGLASLPSLRAYLVSATSEFPGLSCDTTNGALSDTISRLHDYENLGQRLWTPAKLKSMSSFQQQDAQEYYSKILDELDKEILKALKDAGPSESRGLSDAQDSVYQSELATTQAEREDQQDATTNNDSSNPRKAGLQNPLDGLLAQRVGCIRCGYTEGLSMIPFNCITVPLGRDWIYDVRDCLSEYTKLELIEGVNCSKCSLLRTQKTLTGLLKTPEDRLPEASRKDIQSRLAAVNDALEDDDFADNTLIKKCRVPKKSWVSSTKSRQAVIARPPKALAIHVNRSVFDELTGAQMKNYADVRFPKDFDLGPWCLGSQSGDAEEWSEDPTMSMIADLDDFESSPFKYTLRAVVTHYGRHENGHYICYRKHPTNGDIPADQARSEEYLSDNGVDSPPSDQPWWRFSDEDVSRVSEREVLSQGGVFMLFYERCDNDTTPSSRDPSVTTIDASFAALAISSSLEDADTDESNNSKAPLEDAAGVPLPDDEEEQLGTSLQSHVALPSEQNTDDFGGLTTTTPDTSSSLGPSIVSSSTRSPKAHLNLHSTPPPEEAISISRAFSGSLNGDIGLPNIENLPPTQVTGDDDVESEADCLPADVPASQPSASQSPALMRTAGASGNRRNNGSRSSLPMVAAT